MLDIISSIADPIGKGLDDLRFEPTERLINSMMELAGVRTPQVIEREIESEFRQKAIDAGIAEAFGEQEARDLGEMNAAHEMHGDGADFEVNDGGGGNRCDAPDSDAVDVGELP